MEDLIQPKGILIMAQHRPSNYPSPLSRLARNNIYKTKSRLRTVAVSEGVEIKFHRSKWKPLRGSEEVSYAEFFCLVLVDGHEAGMLGASLYRLAGIDNETFIDTMDGESGETYALATAVCEKWSEVAFEVSLLGPIVEIYAAHLEKRFANRVSLKNVINALQPRALTNYSIIALKAFPLRGEMADRSDCSSPSRRKKTAALMRHYKNTFGLKVFPGSAGESGWMWAPNPRGDASFDIR